MSFALTIEPITPVQLSNRYARNSESSIQLPVLTTTRAVDLQDCLWKFLKKILWKAYNCGTSLNTALYHTNFGNLPSPLEFWWTGNQDLSFQALCLSTWNILENRWMKICRCEGNTKPLHMTMLLKFFYRMFNMINLSGSILHGSIPTELPIYEAIS